MKQRLVLIVITVSGAILQGVRPASASHAEVVPALPGFVALHSGKAIDVPDNSLQSGTQMIQWSTHGGTNQQWDLVPFGIGTGVYVIVSRHNKLVLEATGQPAQQGAPVVQEPWEGALRQLWVVMSFGDIDPGADHTIYVIVSALSHQALDVAGASIDDGAPLIQWPWHGGPNQIWRQVAFGIP